MKYHNVTPARIGRKTHLAQALALALALGGGVATTATASPGSMGQTQHMSAAEQQAQQTEAAYQVQYAADAVAASAQPMAVTTYVANCNDSGGGSLRDAVANAASGDTIDMTAMPCNEINLGGPIVVSQNDLTLVGKRGSSLHGLLAFPDTYIHGADRAFYHSGTGTLTLTSIDLSDGYTNIHSGACIYSSGSVMIDVSYVHDCIEEKLAGSSGDTKGGAIYARGKVTLSGNSSIPFASSLVYDNIVRAADGDAYGGGIYAGGWVQIGALSSVYGNLAESFEGNA